MEINILVRQVIWCFITLCTCFAFCLFLVGEFMWMNILISWVIFVGINDLIDKKKCFEVNKHEGITWPETVNEGVTNLGSLALHRPFATDPITWSKLAAFRRTECWKSDRFVQFKWSQIMTLNDKNGFKILFPGWEIWYSKCHSIKYVGYNQVFRYFDMRESVLFHAVDWHLVSCSAVLRIILKLGDVFSPHFELHSRFFEDEPKYYPRYPVYHLPIDFSI